MHPTQYALDHDKVYKGSRSKFSAPKKGSKGSKKKRKFTKSPTRRASSSSSSQSSSVDYDQKVSDFLMIAKQCSSDIASNLLRNSVEPSLLLAIRSTCVPQSWNVPAALEFYFKHKADIEGSDSNSNSNSTKPNRSKSKSSKSSKPESFGKAGTRSAKQKEMVKEQFAETLASIGDADVICFTDGACKGNPGPAGSGCVVLFGKHNRSVMLHKSLALGTQPNNIGELYAIGLALHIIAAHPSSRRWIEALRRQQLQQEGSSAAQRLRVHVLSDSRYSIGVLSKGWAPKKNQALIAWIKAELEAMHRRGFAVRFHWVGGHCDVEFNEMADSLANKGVQASLLMKRKPLDVSRPPSLYGTLSEATYKVRERKRKARGDDVAEAPKPAKRRRLNAKEPAKGRATLGRSATISSGISTPPQSPTAL